MKLITLWGQRRSDPDIVELMVAWDEYCVDANYEGVEQDCEKAKASWGDDLLATREITINVSEKQVRAAFESPQIEGEVEA